MHFEGPYWDGEHLSSWWPILICHFISKDCSVHLTEWLSAFFIKTDFSSSNYSSLFLPTEFAAEQLIHFHHYAHPHHSHVILTMYALPLSYSIFVASHGTITP